LAFLHVKEPSDFPSLSERVILYLLKFKATFADALNMKILTSCVNYNSGCGYGTSMFCKIRYQKRILFFYSDPNLTDAEESMHDVSLFGKKR
jgi:hypothetical protein